MIGTKWPESARWTENNVSERGGRNRERMDMSIARAMNYLMDGEKGKRLEQRLCPACFYGGSNMAGQAFTEWNCRVCLEDQPNWPNTAVPMICRPCSSTHKLCHVCGADLYLRVRRNNVTRLKE